MQTPSRKPVYLIAACSENRVIGRNGTLPWRIREDLQYLYDSVKGGVVIEGRRVWDELKKPFPDTRTIVLTRNPSLTFPGAERASSLAESINMANAMEGYPTIWIGGGQPVYEEAITFADRLYLTLVHTRIDDGDTFFPEWRHTFSHVVSERKSSNTKYEYTFLVLERSAQSLK
jgi:dihydrofolate reductase